MNIGPDGIELIKSYEKCRLVAYKPTPDDVWTCGWGSTKGVTETTVWTAEEADEHFLQDIQWVENCVNKAVKVDITQREFDALCALCFNIGCPRFTTSTLVRELNLGHWDAACKHFLDWTRQDGQVIQGLVNRRIAELKLFQTPCSAS